MATISSGVGLISGFPIEDVVSQLMEIEARPLRLLQQRLAEVQSVRTAYMDLSSRLLALRASISRFDEASFFRAARATSSNSNVLVASASEGATSGNYVFTVHSLVTNHQLISDGFADADQTPVGSGTITLELGNGKLDRATPLDVLNGHQGVRRGQIRITDRSGASAEINLSTAVTIQDVLDAINSATGIQVQATVSGDHIVLTDQTGQTSSNLIVEDLANGHAAADLGIAGSVAADTLTGSDIVELVESTPLRLLNDGNGVYRQHIISTETQGDFQISLRDGVTSFQVDLSGLLRHATKLAVLNSGNGVRLGTIRITDRSGASAEIDLSSATTVQDVLDAINNASGIDVTASVSGSHLLITDNTGSEDSNLKIEDVSGYAARDLGILANVSASAVTGDDIHRVETVGDVLRAINYAEGNPGTLAASLTSGGNGIVLTDSSAGSGTTTVTALNNSTAAEDLGILGSSDTGTITSRDLIAGLNTVLLRSLNGGSGVTTGTVRFQARDGTITDIDLSAAQTVQDILDTINATTSTSKISAAINAAGNGILITDSSGGSGSLVIQDISGTTAADLNIAGSYQADSVDGGSAQLQYVSKSTLLADYNYGQGVAAGRFRITNSAGQSVVIDLTQSDDVALADVIEEINGSGINVTARINDTGDGLLIEDNAGGAGRLTIEEDGSTTAADLHILGQADEGETTIDGSLAIEVEIDADDTLNDVVTKINSTTNLVSAGVINDGSVSNPYRLSLTSQLSGTRGEIVFDPGDVDISMNTLIPARDAVISLGGTGAEIPILITSSTNSLTNVIESVTIDLVGTDDDPVTISVSKDVDSIVEAISTFVDKFNDVLERIDELTAYNAETGERGVLLGDGTVLRIQSRLRSQLTTAVTGADSAVQRLTDLGISVARDGTLRFDEDEFREVFAAHPEAVEQFFTLSDTGFGERLDEELENLTDSYTGLLARHDDALENREELFNNRIEAMQELLDQKEERLRRQFQAMERALASLQAQQSALGSLSAISTLSLYQNLGGF